MKLQLKIIGNLKYYPISNLPVNNSTPPVSRHSLPKGLYGPIIRYANSNRLFTKEEWRYTSPFFKVRYYPTNHFLCLFRKTRPSVTVHTMQMGYTMDDIKLPKVKKYLQKLYVSKKSIDPGDYAVWRRKITVEVKRTFIQEWFDLKGDEEFRKNISATGGIGDKPLSQFDLLKEVHKKDVLAAKDGYYVFNINKFPKAQDMVTFHEHIRKAVRIIAEENDGTSNDNKTIGKKKKGNINWVDRINSRLNINSLNRFLHVSDCPYKITKSN